MGLQTIPALRYRPRSLFALAWPTMATYLAFALLEMCDAWMSGRLGSESLAALMSGQQVLFVLFAIGFGLFTGVNVCVARAEEIHGGHRAGLYTWQGIWIALALGGVVSVLHWTASPLFSWIGHDFGVRVQEIAYLEVAIWSMPFQFVTLALSNFFLAVRRPLVPMKAGFVQVGLNIPFSWFLMFGVEGQFSGLGLVGAAWGTLIASMLGCLLLFGEFQKSTIDRCYHSRKPRWDTASIRNIVRLGLPKSILGFSDVLFWNIALVVYVGSFGTEHMAASAVMYATLMLMLVPGDGMNVALATVSAHSLAAGRPKLATWKLWRGILFNLRFMLVLSLLCVLFRTEILQCFSSDPTVIQIGARLLLFLPWILVADACISALDGWLAGAGDVDWPTKLTLVSSLIIVIAGGWLMQQSAPGFASTGIWIFIALNRSVIAVALGWRWKSGSWRNFRPQI